MAAMQQSYPGSFTPLVAQGSPVPFGAAEPASVSDDAEEEVDQLDSDMDEDDADSASNASPPLVRKPGETVIPSDRLELVLGLEGGPDLSLSTDSFYLISVAAEEFIKRLAEAGYGHAAANGRSVVSYRDLASSTLQYQELMFLRDTVPEPISLAEALQRRAEKEKEGPFDPVITSIPLSGSRYAPPAASASVAASSAGGKAKAKGRSRPSNGHARSVNGDPSYKKPRERNSARSRRDMGASSGAASMQVAQHPQQRTQPANGESVSARSTRPRRSRTQPSYDDSTSDDATPVPSTGADRAQAGPSSKQPAGGQQAPRHSSHVLDERGMTDGAQPAAGQYALGDQSGSRPVNNQPERRAPVPNGDGISGQSPRPRPTGDAVPVPSIDADGARIGLPVQQNARGQTVTDAFTGNPGRTIYSSR